MATYTKREENMMKEVINELREVKEKLSQFLAILPEESLREYTNANDIKKSYLSANREFPPDA